MELAYTQLLGYTGAAIAMGMGAIGSALGVGITGSHATGACARQPKMGGEILNIMLIGQAVAETAGIFALLVALILLFQSEGASFTQGVALFAAGLSTGIGAIGAGYGSGLPSGVACEGVARHPENKNSLTVLSLVGQAVTQTPVIFALVVSLILAFQHFEDSLVTSVALLSAGISMGFGAIGPGIGSGIAAQNAVEVVSRKPELQQTMMRTMLLGQSVAQSTAIYAMVISFILIYIV